LPPLPAIRIEPSGDNDVVDGVAELVGLVVATQPEPVHSDHWPSELSVYRLPLATSSSVPYPAHADCPLSRIRFPPGPVVAPNVQVPALVNRLPLPPGISVEPLAENTPVYGEVL